MQENVFSVYTIQYNPYKFCVVPVFPSVGNNFATFLLPFDPTTWILLAISTVMVSTLLPSSISSTGFWIYRVAWRELISDKVFHVGVLLLGQSGNGDLKKNICRQACRRACFDRLVFFGCYILMTNLYQGSIFDLLTVSELPKVPVAMAELLSSQLPVLTRSFYEWYDSSNREIMYDSTLKDCVIKPLKVAMAGNLRYLQSIDPFDQRLTFVTPGNKAEIIRNISNSEQVNKFETGETFAVMDENEFLTALIEPIMFLGKRLVIHGRGDTGFQSFAVTFGSGNCIVPLFNSGFRRLQEAGFIEIWSRADMQSVRTTSLKWYWKHLYDKYSAQVYSGVPFKQEYQKWAPVSVAAVQNTFAICGTLLCRVDVFGGAQGETCWCG